MVDWWWTVEPLADGSVHFHVIFWMGKLELLPSPVFCPLRSHGFGWIWRYPNCRTSPFLEEHGGVEGAHDFPFRVVSSGSVCAVAHRWSHQSIWTLLAMVTLVASHSFPDIWYPSYFQRKHGFVLGHTIFWGPYWYLPDQGDGHDLPDLLKVLLVLPQWQIHHIWGNHVFFPWGDCANWWLDSRNYIDDYRWLYIVAHPSMNIDVCQSWILWLVVDSSILLITLYIHCRLGITDRVCHISQSCTIAYSILCLDIEGHLSRPEIVADAHNINLLAIRIYSNSFIHRWFIDDLQYQDLQKSVDFPARTLRVPVRYSKVRLGGLRRHLGVKEDCWWNHSNFLGYWWNLDLGYDPIRIPTISLVELLQFIQIGVVFQDSKLVNHPLERTKQHVCLAWRGFIIWSWSWWRLDGGQPRE